MHYHVEEWKQGYSGEQRKVPVLLACMARYTYDTIRAVVSGGKGYETFSILTL
jgi:hypothetical protein